MTMKPVADLICWQELDLREAIRILKQVQAVISKQAGREDPTKLGLEPKEQMQALLDSLCDLSIRDGLTGLVNATFFQSMLAAELDRSSRTGRPCALMLIGQSMEVDFFANV